MDDISWISETKKKKIFLEQRGNGLSFYFLIFPQLIN